MEKPYNFYPKDPSLDLSNKKTSQGIENLMKSLMLSGNATNVVGIVGKSNCGKSEILNFILDRQIFKVLLQENVFEFILM